MTNTLALNVQCYHDLIGGFYKEIAAYGGVVEWEEATGVDVSTRLSAMDVYIPEEINKRSKIKLYVNPKSGAITDRDGHYLPHGSSRWTPNSTFVKNVQRRIFYYNDILSVENATSAYSGGLEFYSHRWKDTYYLMTRNITQSMLVEMTKGVLIGSFTFEKTGGYLAIKMVPVE